MTGTIRRSFLFLMALVPFAVGVVAQEPEAESKPEIDVKEVLGELRKAAFDRKAARDTEAIGLVDRLLQAFEKLDAKQKASVRKALGEILTSKKVKRTKDQTGLYVAAAAALGRMGPEAARELWKAFKSSKFKKREWVTLRAVFLKHIGRTKDPRSIKPLIERARRDPEDAIMAAAGEALGNYEEFPEKVRKDVVKNLIIRYGQVYAESRKNLDPGDPIVQRAKERLAQISQPWNETLRKLTGKDLRTAEEWQRFWNKHKNDRWDKGRPKKAAPRR